MGVWTDTNNEKYIVTEFVSGGALHNYLAADPTQFSVMDLLSMYQLFIDHLTNITSELLRLSVEWSISVNRESFTEASLMHTYLLC